MAGKSKTEDFRVPVAREGLKPSAPQVYGICRCALELLGLDWPSDRREASTLIQRLREHVASEKTQAVAEVAPF